MRTLGVTINDYCTNVKALVHFQTEDFARVRRFWDIADEPNLVRLSNATGFEGYRCWSELTPNHFRVLITRALNLVAELDDASRANSAHPTVDVLNFVIVAFVTCIEDRTSATVESFKVTRLSELNVVFDIALGYELGYEQPKSKAPTFTVVYKNDDQH